MKQRYFLCLLIILWSKIGFTQFTPNELRFNLYNYNFFVNNEYKGERMSGYTLPGFRLTPTLSYSLEENLFIEGGVSLLHYWGANKYPNVVYSNLPSWAGDQFQRGVHAVPFFRAVWQINRSLRFSLGNIDYRNLHGLSEPLYNLENTFSGDPEMGLQLKADTKWFKGDLWLNWQTFVFKNSSHNETFCLGLASQTKILRKEKFELSLPFNIIIQHLGGESLQIKSNINSWVNASLGLKGKVNFSRNFSLYFGGDYLIYNQLSGNIMPFKEGFAQFYYIGAKLKKINMKIAYFDSEDFVSLLGSGHFCNFSSNTPGLVFDRANQFYAKIDYNYLISQKYNIKFYCQLWKQNKITGDRLLPDYSAIDPSFPAKVIRDGFFSFSVGVVLSLEPSFLIKKFD